MALFQPCNWTTRGAHCRLLVRSGLCAWHRTWRSMNKRGLGERAMFEEWVQQFRPGGLYGHNPGQWWPSDEILWAALTGVGDLPTLTRELAMELRARHAECQHFRVGLKPPIVIGQRLEGPPLPPWYGPGEGKPTS